MWFYWRLCCLTLLLLFLGTFNSCKEEAAEEPVPGLLQLKTIKIGTIDLISNVILENAPFDKGIVITFTEAVDRTSAEENIIIKDEDGEIPVSFAYLNEDQSVTVLPESGFKNKSLYTIEIGKIRSVNGKEYPGGSYQFETEQGEMSLKAAVVNGKSLKSNNRITDVPTFPEIKLEFDQALDGSTDFSDFIWLSNKGARLDLTFTLSEDKKTLQVNAAEEANDLAKYTFTISEDFESLEGFQFAGFTRLFYTALDSSYKFPEITDEELLTLIQEQTFKYFWDFAHPASGLARERNTSGSTVTIGGSGFGVMAILVGIERGFITRQQGVDRLQKIVDFLAEADRFHGVWPHWMNGITGKVIPFSTKDNGGDLVETAFMIQGLLTVREYLNSDNPQEAEVIATITQLWEEVEWDWYTQDGQNVLYWHWSTNYGWEMNHQIRGWNEGLIVYVLAASSPTHSVEPEVYHEGWAGNGGMVNNKTYYDITLPLGYDYGGPLFFSHYSFLGLDPRNLEDQYANYWDQNVNHSLINYQHGARNPNNYVGYSTHSWGFTASDNYEGYSAHSPTNDKGVITPTAAISSLPYTPEESMDAIKHFYYLLGDRLWKEYGFVDAFSPTQDWYASSFLAIDQGPIIVMIENHRTGLLWELFMKNTEISNGLDKLGFTY